MAEQLVRFFHKHAYRIKTHLHLFQISVVECLCCRLFLNVFTGAHGAGDALPAEVAAQRQQSLKVCVWSEEKWGMGGGPEEARAARR